MSIQRLKANWNKISGQVASYHRNPGLSLRQRQAAISQIAAAVQNGDDVDRRHVAPLCRLLLAEALRELRRVPTWPRVSLVGDAELLLADATGVFDDRHSELARRWLEAYKGRGPALRVLRRWLEESGKTNTIMELDEIIQLWRSRAIKTAAEMTG